jgi:hypothetical protein
MGFGSLTSFTGGGGLDTSSSADGDNYFNNGDFNYRTGVNSSGADNSNVLLMGGLVLVALYLVSKK